MFIALISRVQATLLLVLAVVVLQYLLVRRQAFPAKLVSTFDAYAFVSLHQRPND